MLYTIKFPHDLVDTIKLDSVEVGQVLKLPNIDSDLEYWTVESVEDQVIVVTQ